MSHKKKCSHCEKKRNANKKRYRPIEYDDEIIVINGRAVNVNSLADDIRELKPRVQRRRIHE